MREWETLSKGLGISTRSVSGDSSCSVQLILRNSIILVSEGDGFGNLYWAGGGEAMGGEPWRGRGMWWC